MYHIYVQLIQLI